MVVNEDFARQDACQGFHREIAGRALPLVELLLIFGSAGPCLAVKCHIAHTGLWHLVARAIDALRVFTTGHF